MTNGEIFKQIFGFAPYTDPCPKDYPCNAPECKDCKYNDWLDQEFTGNVPTIPICKVEFDKDQLKEIVDKAVKEIMYEQDRR